MEYLDFSGISADKRSLLPSKLYQSPLVSLIMIDAPVFSCLQSYLKQLSGLHTPLYLGLGAPCLEQSYSFSPIFPSVHRSEVLAVLSKALGGRVLPGTVTFELNLDRLGVDGVGEDGNRAEINVKEVMELARFPLLPVKPPTECPRLGEGYGVEKAVVPTPPQPPAGVFPQTQSGAGLSPPLGTPPTLLVPPQTQLTYTVMQPGHSPIVYSQPLPPSQYGDIPSYPSSVSTAC